MGLKQLPEAERPRERLQHAGAEALSAAELIAIILGSGTKGISVLQMAHDILEKFGGLTRLAEATLEELQQVKGLGFAKAVQLRAALTLGSRVLKQGGFSRYKITTPDQAYHLVKDELRKEKRELFVVILLNTKGYVIGRPVVAIGTLSQALVHPREVFYPAIRHKAASILLAHNHPSGDPTPSKEDLEITKVLIEVGKLMAIPVHDHLIIGESGYVSLREMGYAFHLNIPK